MSRTTLPGARRLIVDVLPAYCIVVLVLVFSWGTGCGRADEADQPVAEVNGAPITAEDFVQTYVTDLLNTGRNDTPANRYRHLNNLIDTYLLADEARARGLDQDSSFQVYAERERQKALGTRYYEETFLSTLPEPTEAETRQAFINWKRQMVVRHLFFRDEASARASYRRLQAGRDFIEEANEIYGLAAFDSSAGYLGPISYFSTDDAFAEAAFGLEVGSYSEPVRSRHGWHIIRIEDEIRNPILTESEFQTRADGLAGRERLRRRRLEGDRFVRSFMEQREVQVVPDAVRALQALIADLENTAPGAVRGADLRAALRDETVSLALAPSTVLASYELDGERRPFTTQEYLFWLDTMPFAEARHRTGASVGRAMRNHILAAAGEAEGLADDPEVRRLAARAARVRLAIMLRAALRNAPPTVDEALLREAFERLHVAGRSQIVADYVAAPFESRQAAEAFHARLEADPRLIDGADGVIAANGDLLAEPSPYLQAVVRATVGVPSVVGLADGRWFVLRVDRREEGTVEFEEVRAQLAAEVGPYLHEVDLVRTLRNDASIDLDTVRFERLYDLTD